MQHRRLIGILGGMGPAATVDFMAKIIAATSAEQDQDHVPMIVHDIPQIPDRSLAIGSGSDAPFLPMLSGVRMLDAAGVDYIAIPCNTAHHWHARLNASSRAKILHIADAAVDQLRAAAPGCVAIMSTRGTLRARIYEDRLHGAASRVLLPDEATQVTVDKCIEAVKAGNLPAAMEYGVAAVDALALQGADSVLMACTELPVALAEYRGKDIRLVDPTDALARVCVKAALDTLEWKVAV